MVSPVGFGWGAEGCFVLFVRVLLRDYSASPDVKK